jgi:hypothetical protein
MEAEAALQDQLLPRSQHRIRPAGPVHTSSRIQWLGIVSWALFCAALFVSLLLRPDQDAVDRGIGLQADDTLQRAIVSVPATAEAGGSRSSFRRQRPDPADGRGVASMGMLAWLEAAGGGYPDRDVRRRSDNHARILSEARGPEEAKAAWASEPALILRPLPVAKAQQRCASGRVEIARWLQRCSRAATIGQLNSKPGRKTHARAVLESQATSQRRRP